MKKTKTAKGVAMVATVISAFTVLVLLLVGCSREAIDRQKPGNGGIDMSSETQSATSLMTAPRFNVMDYGAVGDGTTDDTEAFQDAIDAAAATGVSSYVDVPPGSYLIDADVSIRMRSNVYLDMVDTDRELIAKPTASDRYYVIRMVNISNSRVIGGKIIGDRTVHLDSTGEWGMGIGIYGAWNARVYDTHIVDCWGDGITIGTRSALGATQPSTKCVIRRVVCNNNRRQGLTIGSVDSLIVEYSTFTNTNETLPMDGIDIEPDNGTAQKVHITNCEIAHNLGNGIEMNAKTNTTAVIKDIYVHDNFIHDNTYSGYVQHVDHVTFTNNRMINNQYDANRVHVVDATNSVFDPNDYD